MANRTGVRILSLIFALVIALVLTEVLLRAIGRRPWRNLGPPDAPSMHEPDPDRGWRNKPGEYVFGKDRSIRMTFWPGNFRATAEQPSTQERVILVLGGSFTQGWAVSDHQTWPYAFQQEFPEYAVKNLATSGYGTYQSLLALEHYLSQSAEPPALVIYGFNDFHDARNVAAASWLRVLSRVHDRAVSVPYSTQAEDGSLVRHPPESWPDWPLKRLLTSVALAEEAWANVRIASRASQATAVTDSLIREMDQRATRAGSRLRVAVLSDFRQNLYRHYLEFLTREQIDHVDCAYPDDGTTGLTVPGYAHPSAIVHAYWAECIAAAEALDTG